MMQAYGAHMNVSDRPYDDFTAEEAGITKARDFLQRQRRDNKGND